MPRSILGEAQMIGGASDLAKLIESGELR